MRLKTRLKKKQITVKNFEEAVQGVCCQCTSGCGVVLYKEAKQPIELYGDEFHPINKGALCPKVMALYRQIYHETRLDSPCVRESTRDPWQAVDWDVAMDFMASKLEQFSLADELAILGHENDPFDARCGAGWVAEELKLALHPDQFLNSAFGEQGALRRMFGISGEQLSSNTPRDWCASRVILLVGGDLAAESPISFGPLQDVRDRGAALLYLGAQGGMTARRCSQTWIVRPGTESLALASVAHVLLREQWIDSDFVNEWTRGLEGLQARLEDFAPETVAPQCGLEAGRLEELARILVKTDPVQVITGQMSQRRWLDDATLTLSGLIPVLRGCLGRPGGGFNVLGSSPFTSGRIQNPVENDKAVSLEMLLQSGRLRAVMGHGDWVQRLAGDAARKAIGNLPFVVHLGPFDNATRNLAHVSLPTSHWMEYASLVSRNDSRALQWRNALLEPYKKSLSPLAIWGKVLSRLNPKAMAPWAEQPDQVADQHCLARWMLARCPLTPALRLEDLENENITMIHPGGMLWPCMDDLDCKYETSRYVNGTIRGQHNILFTPYSTWAGTDHRFPAKEGRIQIDEVVLPDPAVITTAPLLLIVGEAVDQVADHPQDTLWPVENMLHVVRLNPDTAAGLSITPGTQVTLKTKAGELPDVTALTSPDVPEGVAILPPDIGLALVEGNEVLRPIELQLIKHAN